MYIDSMKLAYFSFQRCRHYFPDTASWLRVLEHVLRESLSQGVLTVEVDDTVVAPLSPDAMTNIRGDARPSPVMTPAVRRSLSFCLTSARELHRLYRLGCRTAVRALGLELHNLPSQIREQELGDWEGTVLSCLSMAAPFWDQLETDMRESLAAGAGLTMAEAEMRVNTEGFASALFRDEARNDD